MVDTKRVRLDSPFPLAYNQASLADVGEAVRPKQQRFVQEYLIDLNATQAYLRAGYSVSKRVAAANASELLTKPNVAAAVAAGRLALAEVTGWTQRRVIEELETNMKAGRAEDLASSNKAIELIGKHLGMWPAGAGVQVNGDRVLVVFDV